MCITFSSTEVMQVRCVDMTRMNTDRTFVRLRDCEAVILRRQARTAGTISDKVRALLHQAAWPIRFEAAAVESKPLEAPQKACTMHACIQAFPKPVLGTYSTGG
jgi:hypothetical protein